MQTINAQIRLDTARYAVLAEESKRRAIPVEALVNDLVQQYLDEVFTRREAQPTAFMAIVGLGDSGHSDVSRNHDKYLGEALAHEHLR